MILKTFYQDIHNKTAIKANFHFSHYKSMETLSCHSNQNEYATAIKTEFSLTPDLEYFTPTFCLDSKFLQSLNIKV